MELFESSNDIIYTMNFNGNFTSVNPWLKNYWGTDLMKMNNPNMIRFITPETAKLAFDNIKAKLQGDKSSTVYEVEFLKKDGTYISLGNKQPTAIQGRETSRNIRYCERCD